VGETLRETGEKVQMVEAGIPEQEKVSVPETVLVGVTKIVASVVEPSATATVVRPLMGVRGVGHRTVGPIATVLLTVSTVTLQPLDWSAMLAG